MDMFEKRKKRAFEIDRSNIGRIDKRIKGLVDAINRKDNYFTTSSCSGRIMVIKRQGKKTNSKILFCSHEKVTDSQEIEKVIVTGGDVWLLFNACILHVCCRTIEDAMQLFSLAKKAGFKRQGIISTKNTVMVEIMGTDHMEIILADDEGTYYTKEGLDRYLYYANKKFEKNLQKIKAFEDILK